MKREAALTAWLDRALAADVPFWGTADCFLWPADWVVACGWPDPAAAFRGRYRTPLGAARLVRRSGGAGALWRAQASRIGLAPTAKPRPGDVGLVRTDTVGVGPTLRGQVGAVHLGGGEWAARTPGGLRMGRWPVMEAWRVPWRS